MHNTVEEICYLCNGEKKISSEDYTCHSCSDKDSCKYAWDAYNTNGDCLASK